MAGNISNIPDFIIATSPKGLRRLMLKNNIKYKAEFSYYDIQTFTDKREKLKFIAWYIRPLDLNDLGSDLDANITE